MRIIVLVAAAVVVALVWMAFNGRLHQAFTSGAEETVVVVVYWDHYEIGGHRYVGPLSGQLDQYANAKHLVSIQLRGDPKVVSSRISEIGHLMGKPNIRMAWISKPEQP
jgi:hypothetical protein